MTTLRQHWRLAMRLHRIWIQGRNDAATPPAAETILNYHRDDLSQVAGLFRCARNRQWQVASATLNDRYSHRLADLCDGLQSILKRMREEPPPAVTPADWYREVQQLEAEFDSVDVSWENHTLTVPVEPITLEEVDLGPFAIEFHWQRLDRPSVDCFEIEALEPNPASGNDLVTHPHVRDRALCAGDAAAPIAQALKDGRLTDAFLLVRSVLRQYNPSSPFIDLEHWHGSPCRECGARVHPEESFYCEGCDNDFCEDCFGRCSACRRDRCASCLSECAVCETSCCSRCLVSIGDDSRDCCPDCRVDCAQCGETYPSDEMDDRLLCSSCAESEPLSGGTDDDSAPTEVVVLAPGVAEAPVLLPSG